MNSKQALIAILAGAGCCWAAWQSARIGYGRTLAVQAARVGSLTAADRAVAWTASDPEGHFARGDSLERRQSYAEAAAEFESAVRLRPRDYYLWLRLGLARDQNQDQTAALRALSQSTALAPAYANARWQLGNLLLRMGRRDEAFVELRRAASSNPQLWPNIIDLAWGVHAGKVAEVEDAIAPRSDSAHMALAMFFATHGQAVPAARQFLMASSIREGPAQALLNQLLAARAFTESYQVWKRLQGLSANSTTGADPVINGGFEEPILLGRPGFGWQVAPNLTNVTMSVDQGQLKSGAKSLRMEFHGNSDPEAVFLSQLVLTSPRTHYRLSFWARSERLISAALPIVVVNDVSGPKSAVLVESETVPPALRQWREFVTDFTTGALTTAVAIRVRRQTCPNNPCPAEGLVWLDSFALQPVAAVDTRKADRDK